MCLSVCCCQLHAFCGWIEHSSLSSQDTLLSPSHSTCPVNRLESACLSGVKLCERLCRSYTTFIRRLVSPMFFSTAEDGSTQRGLAGLPNDRPMLLVGNHQTFALDLGLFVEQIVRERGFLPRGLAHPAIFSVSACCRPSLRQKEPFLHAVAFPGPILCVFSLRWLLVGVGNSQNSLQSQLSLSSLRGTWSVSRGASSAGGFNLRDCLMANRHGWRAVWGWERERRFILQEPADHIWGRPGGRPQLLPPPTEWGGRAAVPRRRPRGLRLLMPGRHSSELPTTL